ncbi:hypothetical protein ACLK1X_15905 [Escherichia coli]
MVYWWYSNESCASMTKVKNTFLVPLATQMAPILSQSQIDCLVGRSRQTDPRITGSAWCGDCRGWQVPRYL